VYQSGINCSLSFPLLYSSVQLDNLHWFILFVFILFFEEIICFYSLYCLKILGGKSNYHLLKDLKPTGLHTANFFTVHDTL